MASPFVELLGDTLLHDDFTATATGEALAGKTVGLYFSAHWCPPCRGFTPELADAYHKLRAAGKPFELVFISSDHDAEQYMEYAKTMPWLSLPFCNSDAKAALSQRFKVEDIPTLVILDENGGLITAHGREAVGDNPAGFPWQPRPLLELLAGPLVDASGATRTLPLYGYVALYFGASWCVPCLEFSPQLVKAYEAVHASGGQLEVVFVSAHSGEAEWREYLQHMPWLAVHHDNDDRISALRVACAVRDIPHLVLCDAATGKIVNPSVARAAVEAERPFPEGWLPPL